MTKAVNTETNEVVAIKTLFQKTTWDEALVMREIKSLKVLNQHPNIIKIKEMAIKREDERLHVVFEFCDRSLL